MVAIHALDPQFCLEHTSGQEKGLSGMVHRSTPLCAVLCTRDIQTTCFESVFIQQLGSIGIDNTLKNLVQFSYFAEAMCNVSNK